MNDKMALNLIAEIMGWDEGDAGSATREYAWLRLMSAVKFDSYADFRPGVRFLESLATWLKQFEPCDRRAAYDFVKHRLVYVSPAELQRLIETFVPEVVTPNLRETVAAQIGSKPYEVWQTADGAGVFRERLRKTLFVGMSDGSRIDVVRRANARRLSPEQVVPMMNIDDEKWRDLEEKISGDLGAGVKFDSVYLVDDFTASGTTFIRNVNGIWKGKLKKFNDIILNSRKSLKDGFPLAEAYDLHIHHYISSYQARDALLQRMKAAHEQWPERSYGSYFVSEGLRLPESLKLVSPIDDPMLDLCERYYDHALFKRLEKHCIEAGQSDMKLGYAECALPIVLDHNTPNNSIPLLWAETAGENAHPMRPLFQRRDRHG